jgi:hypothetical protein
MSSTEALVLVTESILRIQNDLWRWLTKLETQPLVLCEVQNAMLGEELIHVFVNLLLLWFRLIYVFKLDFTTLIISGH